MNIVIKNATIVDSSSEFNHKQVDIKIENGVIAEIGIKSELFDNPKEQRTKEFLRRFINQ